MISIEKMFSLKGHTVIVTGGSRGIGRKVSDYLAAAGADIAIIGTRADTTKQAADEIASAFGVRTTGIACNVADRKEVFAMLDKVEEILGLPDLLLNNAGVSDNGPSETLTEEEWRHTIDINLTGAFFVIQAFAKKLLDAGHPGSIVNVASMCAHITCFPQREAAYNASKAGLLHLSKSLAVEWAQKGIRVNCISPGYIMTDMTAGITSPELMRIWLDMTPAGRLGREEELAGAVIYLMSDAASFTTGSEIVIDGAYTVL